MRPKVSQLRRLDNPTPAEAGLIAALHPFAPDAGFHYIYDAENEEIHEPTLLFLYARHGHAGRRDAANDEPSLATNRSAAFELAEWLRFCAHVQRRWDRADHDLLCLYAQLLASRISYHTGRARDAGTIAHKLSTIYGFYGFSNSIGLTDVRWDAPSVRASYRRSKTRGDRSDDHIRPFSTVELRRLLAELGPLPSARAHQHARSCRDRLVFETGLLTGMRGEEICHLRVKSILALPVVEDRPDETQPLRIHVTKGRKIRWIALPNSLIAEMRIYVGGERRIAISGKQEHGRLFVNQAGHPKAGAPMTTNTIHRRTHALMVRSGLTETSRRTVDGREVAHVRTLHSFHDTRHTYAVHLYLSQKAAGDSEPWKTVQHMLGHENWKTTEQHYLRAVGVFETQIGVRLNRYWETD